MNRHMKRWAAIYILALMFLGSWLGQFFTQLIEVRNDAEEHHQAFAWADFWPQFFSATFENWQSEFLQLAFQGVLIASILGRYIFAADDGADKEDVEKILDKIDEIKRR